MEPIKITLDGEVPTEAGWYFAQVYQQMPVPMLVKKYKRQLGIVVDGRHIPFDGREESLIRWSRRLVVE